MNGLKYKNFESRKFQVAVANCHQEPCLDRLGTMGVRDPDTIEEVTVEVDFAGIARKLGQRAARNKSGTARYLHGLIRVTHLRKKATAKCTA